MYRRTVSGFSVLGASDVFLFERFPFGKFRRPLEVASEELFKGNPPVPPANGDLTTKQGSLKDLHFATICIMLLFPPKYRETTIYKAMFRCTMQGSLQHDLKAAHLRHLPPGFLMFSVVSPGNFGAQPASKGKGYIEPSEIGWVWGHWGVQGCLKNAYGEAP